MELSTSIILYELSLNNDYECMYGALPKHHKFCGAKLFDPYTETIDKKYIYLISIDDLQHYRETCKIQQGMYLCLNNNHIILDRILYESITYVELSSSLNIETLLNSIIDIFMSFQKWDKNVHIAILKDATTQEIINLCEPLLDYPLILFGPSLNVLGYTQNISTEYFGYIDTIHSGYTKPETMQELQSNSVHENVLQNDKPFVITHGGARSFVNIHFKFTHNGKILGFGGVFDCQANDLDGYLELINLISENICLYFINRATISQRLNTYEEFLISLLEEPNMSEEKLENQINQFPELNTYGPSILAKIFFHNTPNMPLQYYCHLLQNNIDARVFIYHNELYVLRQSHGTDKPQLFNKKEFHIIEQTFQDFLFIICLSNVFFHIRHIAQAKIQCDQTLKHAIRTQEQPAQFLYYRDYFYLHLLSQLDKTYQKMLCSSGDYQRLKNYDLANPKENLCDIYMCYIKKHTNITETANELFMHRNTIINKLKKIEEILNTDPNELNTQILFALTYQANH